MESIKCLNCETSFSGNFCPECGQKSSTRRYSWSYVFSKDFVADLFNFDRGFLHTLKDLSYRPGHLVNDYLRGKRKSYFNAIGLLLILLTVEAVLWSLAHNSVAEVLTETIRQQILQANRPELAAELSIADVESMLRNQKLIFLIAVPLSGFFSWLILRRLGYNYLEHCIMVVFLLSINTWLGLFLGLIGLLPLELEIFKAIYFPFSFVVLAFDFLLIWQFSQAGGYKRGGRIWRSVATLIFVTGILGATLQFSVGVFHGVRVSDPKVGTELAE